MSPLLRGAEMGIARLATGLITSAALLSLAGCLGSGAGALPSVARSS